MKWIAGVGILVWAVTLNLLCAAIACAQTQSFERELAAVAARGIDRPVVAVIPRRTPQTNADSTDQASLAGFAERWGLKVFEQDGIYVLADPFSLDLSSASGAMVSARIRDPDAMVHYLPASLDREQMAVLGSPGGLRYRQLGPDQQQALASLFSRDNSLADCDSDDQPEDTSRIPANGVKVEDVSLTGCLYASSADVRCDSDSCVSGGPYSEGRVAGHSGNVAASRWVISVRNQCRWNREDNGARQYEVCEVEQD